MYGLEIIIVHIVNVKMDQLYVQKKIVQFYNVNLYENLNKLFGFCFLKNYIYIFFRLIKE